MVKWQSLSFPALISVPHKSNIAVSNVYKHHNTTDTPLKTC